jgi:hypothetical protein
MRGISDEPRAASASMLGTGSAKIAASVPASVDALATSGDAVVGR